MASLALQLCAFAALTVLASAIPISELPRHLQPTFCDPQHSYTGSGAAVLLAAPSISFVRAEF